MTTADPSRLVDALDTALDTWAAPAREHLPLATFCATSGPDDSLCRHLRGHTGDCGEGPESTWTNPNGERDA